MTVDVDVDVDHADGNSSGATETDRTLTSASGPSSSRSSSSSPQLLPKLYSTIDEINNHLKNQDDRHQHQQSTPLTSPSTSLNNNNDNSNKATARAPHLFLHFDINETILIGDPAGGDSVTECLNKVIAKSAFVSVCGSVSTNVIDDDADDNCDDEHENESGVNALKFKRSPSSGNISSESTHQLKPINWWNGQPLPLPLHNMPIDINAATATASTTNSSQQQQPNINPNPPPLYTGWMYPPSTCPYYRTSYKQHAKQFTTPGMHGEVYRPLYKELCTKVGIPVVNVVTDINENENEKKDGVGKVGTDGIEMEDNGGQEQGKEEEDLGDMNMNMFQLFIPAFFYTLQHYFPSTKSDKSDDTIIINNQSSTNIITESSSNNGKMESSSTDNINGNSNSLNHNNNNRQLPAPPKKVTLILRTFGTDLPKVAKVISAFAQGQHPHFSNYYNEDLILEEDSLFCGGWRYLDASTNNCGDDNDAGKHHDDDEEQQQELIYELHPPPSNKHKEPTAFKPATAIYSGDDEVLNYLQSKTIVGIQDNYPFWRDHNHEPWSGKPVWARVANNNDNSSDTVDDDDGASGNNGRRSGHVSQSHHHILLDDNIHNDPKDGAGGIRIPAAAAAAAATSDHTVYESLHGDDALQMHGKHLIRVPTIRPLLEDNWFIRQIEQARLAVFMEENGGEKTDVGDAGDKASTTGTVGKDPLSLVMTNRNLEENDFHYMKLPLNLQNVDLSRNRLKNLPDQIFAFSKLLILDVSRNSLQSFPTAIKQLQNLVELNALSNHLRMNKMPLEELASLTNLRVLDLRYNRKLKQMALTTLEETLLGHNPQLEIRCTITTEDESEENDGQCKKKKKLSACDRDATLLQSQLEPLSTPQLAKRLERSFNVLLDRESEQAYDREYIMETLLDCYAKHGPREIRYEKGISVPAHRLSALYTELEAIPWPRTTRERPKIKAEYYMILQKPGSGKADSARTKKEAAKLNKYIRVFDLAVETLKEVDADFANRFTALAVTKNFVGSPHIDTLNVGPFYGLSLGEFTGGGNIAVECSPFLVAEVETRGRFGKVDGRFPHWVTPYDGTRYSLIYYVTSGTVEPQSTAIFAPPQPSEDAKSQAWVPPPAFIQ